MGNEMDGIDTVMFKDRKEAGMLLARRAEALRLKDVLVLAIPRGGIIIGREVAGALHAELDIVTPRKLRDPFEPELAIGAVMHDGSAFLNEEIVVARGVQGSYIEEEKKRQVAEASRRLTAYRNKRPYPKIKGRAVLLVDDGVATGATMIAAMRWVRKQGAARIIIATPVIAGDVLKLLEKEADKIIYLAVPSVFYGIGQFYSEFEQVEDKEVIRTLNEYWKQRGSK